jgi:arsenate reductase-like glutaredoxin family protein
VIGVVVVYLRIQEWLEKQFLTLQEITRRRVREYKEYNDDNNTNTITFHLV